MPSIESDVTLMDGSGPNFHVGDEVCGYQILDVLGRGGMGMVLKVRNVMTGKVDAMKVILPVRETDPDYVSRFRREIQIQSALHHPNIAAMHTAIRHEMHILMLLEFVDGITVRELLKKGPIPVADCVEFILQLLDALAYAHERGVIHRDINPSNVMITASNRVKLMDFGIARRSDSVSLTQTGMVVGSLLYMSPEQFSGSSRVDSRTDLFSAGVLLYEMATGHLPVFEQAERNLMQADQFAPRFDAKLPAELREVVTKSIEDDPEKRFQSASAFRSALIAAARSLPASAPPPATPCAARIAPPRHLLRVILRLAPAIAFLSIGALVIAHDATAQKTRKELSASTRTPIHSPATPRAQLSIASDDVAAPTFELETPEPERLETAPAEVPVAVVARRQLSRRKLVMPDVHPSEPAPTIQTFSPPPLTETAVPDVSTVGIKLEHVKIPSAPVVLNARHMHHMLRSVEGSLTVYGEEYRFQEFNSTHVFAGSTADLLASCRPQKTSCTVQVEASRHKESIKFTPTPELWAGHPRAPEENGQ